MFQIDFYLLSLMHKKSSEMEELNIPASFPAIIENHKNTN